MEDPLSAPQERRHGHLEADSGVIDGNYVVWNVAVAFPPRPPFFELAEVKRWRRPIKRATRLERNGLIMLMTCYDPPFGGGGGGGGGRGGG